MKTLSTRTALAVGAATFAILFPTATAIAAGEPAAATAAVARLATDAARHLSQERDLVGLAPAPSDEAWEQLAAVDDAGQSALASLDRLGVDLPPSARAALGPVDLPADGTLAAPSADVYDVAIAGLERIAATPDAFVAEPSASGNAMRDLAVVMVIALVVLAVAARAGLERRHVLLTEWSDELTGVANRRRLDHDVALGGDPELGPTAAIVVDVDRLDSVNATFGHATGDGVLRSLGDLLSTSVRDHDVVYRAGGGEFCVLLVGASTEDALTIADRVHDAAHTITLPDGSHATVSVGVAVGAADALSDVVRFAGHAMADAKVGGRDRVRTAAHLAAA